MSAPNGPSGRIVLFGATGYTGELTARAMVERGLRPVLAARRREPLDALAHELGGLETQLADVSGPPSVNALVGRGDVLVTTVGPFVRWGDAALEAAIGAGAHYVDSTGEPGFIRRVFETAASRAREAGSVVLTAMGYDWAPGNLAGALALRDAGAAATRVRIGYFARGGLGGMSGGTRASTAEAMLEPSFQFRGGRLVTERAARKLAEFELDGKRWQAVSIGTSEAFALPRVHEGLRDVEVYLGWFGKASRAMQGFGLLGAGIGRVPGARRGYRTLAQRFVKTSTGGPDEAARSGSSSLFVAEADAVDGRTLARVELRGVNGYEFTGRMLAWCGDCLAGGGVQRSGAIGPVEAFGLERFEHGVAESGIARIDQAAA